MANKAKTKNHGWTIEKVMRNADILKFTAIERGANIPNRALSNYSVGIRKIKGAEEKAVCEFMDKRIG